LISIKVTNYFNEKGLTLEEVLKSFLIEYCLNERGIEYRS